MQKIPGVYSRKKILLQAAALISGLPLIGFLSFRYKKKNKTNDEAIIMLSEDGKLVKVDKKLLTGSGKKINNEEMQRWIKNKPHTDGK
jgi:hypothetical protein